jgi:cytoskeleton protein RodZ
MGKAVYGARGNHRPRGQTTRRPNGRAREEGRPVSVRLVEVPRPAPSAPTPAADAMTFGDHLRAARTARGITVREISVRTRIALRSLEALEQNEIGKLPGGIFSRAFVRAYAQEVGLDPDDTVRMFVQKFPVDHVTAGTTDAVDGEIGRGHEAQKRRQRLGYLLAAAIGLPLVGLAAYLIVSARRPANAAFLAPVAAIETTAAAAPPASTVPATGSAATISPNATSATAASNSTTAARTGTAAVSGSAAGNAAPGTGLASAQRTAGASASGAAPGASALAASDALRIAIDAAGQCWVRVRSDGTIRYQGLLQTGDKQTGEARDNLELIVGDAGTFRFTINGHPGRVVGKPGEVVVVHITRANWQDWLQR